MIIYPAIDVKDGNCVRLEQGKMDKVTQFNTDLVKQAQEFADAGFSWLHMVDLDGAVKGAPVNHKKIYEVIEKTNLNVQVGGGIRTLENIREYLDSGAKKVILGTAAINNFSLLQEACATYPGSISVGVDARSNKVAIDGWLNESEVYVLDLIEKLKSVGVSSIIYTDITKDGLLSGFDESGSKEVAKSIDVPMIVSGGVSSLADLEKVALMQDFGVSGVIVGRAFYDKRISYAEALKLEI